MLKCSNGCAIHHGGLRCGGKVMVQHRGNGDYDAERLVKAMKWMDKRVHYIKQAVSYMSRYIAAPWHPCSRTHDGGLDDETDPGSALKRNLLPKIREEG